MMIRIPNILQNHLRILQKNLPNILNQKILPNILKKLINNPKNNKSKLKNKQIPLQQDKIPKNQTSLQIKSPQKKRIHPLNPKNRPKLQFLLLQKPIQPRIILRNNMLQTTLHPFNIIPIKNKILIQKFIRQNQITKILKSLIRSINKQQKSHQIAHSLNILNIRSINREHL